MPAGYDQINTDPDVFQMKSGNGGFYVGSAGRTADVPEDWKGLPGSVENYKMSGGKRVTVPKDLGYIRRGDPKWPGE